MDHLIAPSTVMTVLGLLMVGIGLAGALAGRRDGRAGQRRGTLAYLLVGGALFGWALAQPARDDVVAFSGVVGQAPLPESALEGADDGPFEMAARWAAEGRLDEARTAFELAAEQAAGRGDRRGEGAAWLGLGRIEALAGDHKGSRNAYARALFAFRQTEDTRGQGHALAGLGLAASHVSPAEARQYLTLAAARFEQVGDGDGRDWALARVRGMED